MAKLPALVTALSEWDERDRATIDFFARMIREGGLIPTTKRGSGAADMTVREAANLLIGANTADSPRAAPMVVPQYRSLRPQSTGGEEREGILGLIDSAATFGDALEVAIENASEIARAVESFIDVVHADRPEQAREAVKRLAIDFEGMVPIQIEFWRPTPFALIRVDVPLADRSLTSEWKYRVDSDLFMAGHYPDRRRDRTTVVTVGLRTLRAIGAVVSAEVDIPTASTSRTAEDPTT